MLSESIWKKEKSILEEEASDISTLKKEIVVRSLCRAKKPKSMPVCSAPSMKKSKC
jgi:hypothetical protein